jgi:glucosamine--fructose-6-phosphate aminotransferase (isomerizing)
MCGIVGYVGPKLAADVLLAGLSRLEYRGYDSAGIATIGELGLRLRKLAGRVDSLRQAVSETAIGGSCGIAHTRWATHGVPTEANAHPHLDCRGRIAIVHNGIIENADVLRRALCNEQHTFRSETDSEVLAHLIERSTAPTLEARVIDALGTVEGTLGIAVVDAAEPDKIVVARRGSPVLLGVGDDELFVASDVGAVLEYTRSVVYLADGDIAVLTRDGHRVIDRWEQEQERPVDTIDWDLEALSLGTHAHFMHKEIHEQASAVARTITGRLNVADGNARLNGLNLDDAGDYERIRRVLILGCGTSWHAGLVGRHIIEQLAGVPVDVEYASEFRSRRRMPMRDILTVAISQSGETADTLEAVRAAREAGSHVVGLVNVVGSTIARETDGGIYLHAGPEIGVASTKAFTAQVTALALLGLAFGRHCGLSPEEGRVVAKEIASLPDLIGRTLTVEPQIRDVAEQIASAQSALFLGRGVNLATALEGALKLKEVSYIHAEGYPAAEMKHGAIALIDEHTPVVVVAPSDNVYTKTVSNMQEVKARRGRLIAITTEGNGDLGGIADVQIRVPQVSSLLSPAITVLPLQLLAYHTAVLRGCDVDRPRNLAKSVTVE